MFGQHIGSLSNIMESHSSLVSEWGFAKRRSNKTMDPCFSSSDRICARHIIVLISGEFVFKGFCSSVATWNLLTSMSGIHWAEWGVFLQLQPTLSPNQMMRASCHMSTVCKQCDQTPPSNEQWKGKRKRPPQVPLLLTSLATISLKLDCLWS